MKIVIEVNKVDPLLVREIPDPVSMKSEDFHAIDNAKANQLFDEKLKLVNSVSRLASSTHDPESLIREIGIAAGLCRGESGFIDTILNPDKNKTLLDTLYPATLDVKSRILNHIHFTFQKKLSHTADSQEQRHRTLPGSRPILASQLSLEDDYITPLMINQTEKAKRTYDLYMEENFSFLRELHQNGVSPNHLTYLLPNAFPVRFYESGDFLNSFHKWKARLCYTSQEEIFYSTLDEVKQVTSKYPFFEKYIGAPCALRKNIKPICPEGDKYCGVKVWKLKLNQYSRKI
jgi:hypothetical protein